MSSPTSTASIRSIFSMSSSGVVSYTVRDFDCPVESSRAINRTAVISKVGFVSVMPE